MTLQIGFDVPFEEAIAAARARGVVLPEVYYGQLQGVARALSFSVAGLSQVDQLQQVLDSLVQALEQGSTFADWKKRLLMAPDALKLPNHRLDNIFRTNLQSAYSRGHWQQHDQYRASRPYLLYSAINDSRVRPHHLALDGLVAAIDDPIWQRHYPPNGYRCRCSAISLSDKKAQKYRDRDAQKLRDHPDLARQRMEAQPDKGWDYHGGADDPVERMKRIEAEKLAKVDPRLKEGYTERMNRTEAEQTLLDTLANAVAVAEAAKTFAEVWRGGDRSYQRHAEKRLQQGHIDEGDAYITETKTALNEAKIFLVAKGGNAPMVAIESGKWVLVYTLKGELVTSFAIEAGKESFSQRHKRLKWEVSEVLTNDSIAETVRRIYSRYEQLLP